VAQWGQAICLPRAYNVEVNHTDTMENCPFLTNAQVEELDRFGMIDLTDDMLDNLFEWAFADEQQQTDS